MSRISLLRDSRISSRSDNQNVTVKLPQRVFERYFKNSGTQQSLKLEMTLRRSRMGINFSQFYSSVAFYQIIFAVASIIAAIPLSLLERRFAFIIAASVFLLNVIFLAGQLEMPTLRATRLRKSIDSVLTLSIGFFATMASSGLTIDEMMRVMGENHLYGAISDEARLIYIRTSLFGMDIISSIRESVRTNPSQRLADLLQGVVTSINSGGDVKEYFLFRANESQDDTRARLRQNAESMGVLSESFITVGVAFPLILLIIIAVIADLFPLNTTRLTLILFLISGLVIPVLIAVFAYFMQDEAGGIEL